jgi:hypothetical protein
VFGTHGARNPLCCHAAETKPPAQAFNRMSVASIVLIVLASAGYLMMMALCCISFGARSEVVVSCVAVRSPSVLGLIMVTLDTTLLSVLHHKASGTHSIAYHRVLWGCFCFKVMLSCLKN